MRADWLRKMDQEMRRFGSKAPIDDLLPELDSGHLGGDGALVAPMDEERPPPEPHQAVHPAMMEPGPEAQQAVSPAMVEPEPESPGSVDPTEGFEPGVEVPEESTPEALQAEIAEFMNRDDKELSEDDDFSDLLSGGIDPNAD